MKIVLEDWDIQTIIRQHIEQTNLLGLAGSDFGIDILFDEENDEVTATIDTNVSIDANQNAPVEKKQKRKRRTSAQMAAKADPGEDKNEPRAVEPDTTGDAPFVPDPIVLEEKEEKITPSKSLFA